MQYYQPNARVHYTDCILQNDKSTSTFYLNTKSNSQVFIWCFPIFCFSTSFWVMVSALGCWLRGSSLRIGRVILSSSWERHFVLTVHPPRREARYGCVFGTGACSVRVRVRYGCVFGTGACPVRLPANYQENLMKCWEVTLRWTDIPSRGE